MIVDRGSKMKKMKNYRSNLIVMIAECGADDVKTQPKQGILLKTNESKPDVFFETMFFHDPRDELKTITNLNIFRKRNNNIIINKENMHKVKCFSTDDNNKKKAKLNIYDVDDYDIEKYELVGSFMISNVNTEVNVKLKSNSEYFLIFEGNSNQTEFALTIDWVEK